MSGRSVMTVVCVSGDLGVYWCVRHASDWPSGHVRCTRNTYDLGLAGKQVGGEMVRDSHGRSTPPHPARNAGDMPRRMRGARPGRSEAARPNCPGESVSPSRVVPAVIAVASPRFARTDDTEGAG